MGATPRPPHPHPHPTCKDVPCGHRRGCTHICGESFFFFFLLGSKQGPNRMISSVLVGKIIPGRYQTTLFIVSFFCISSSSLSLCSTKLLSPSVFFLCLLIFFVFSLFNFLVCVPYMTWSILNTE